MGLFDRLRSGGPAPAGSSEAKPDSTQEASRLIDEGNALEDAGRLEDAMQRYEAALLLVPDFARAYLNRGNILSAKGDTEGALAAYSTAIKCNPDYAAAHYNMGNAFLRSDRRDAALNAYNKAVRLKPDFVDAEMARGNVLIDLRRFDDAVASYRRTLEIRPDDLKSHINLGNALQELNRPDEAVTSYRMALKIQPNLAVVHSNLGIALQTLGMLDEAQSCYRQALKNDPDYVPAYSNLGNILQELGKREEAVASYRRALQIDPAFADAHINLGNVLRDLGQLEEAVISYHRAIEIKPDYAEAHGNLGTALKDLGQLEEALVSIRRAIEIAPEFVEAHNNLGVTLHELGQYLDATASYRRALEIKPDYAEAHSNLGNTLKELGRLDDAVASCRRALELKPDYAEAYLNLGNALKDLGQLDDAETNYHRALEIKPDFIVAYSNLLFSHNYRANQPASVMLADAMSYGKVVARKARTFTTWSNPPEPDRCLRVGFVSGDLRQHPVGNFLEGVLAALAAKTSGRLEFFAYPSYSSVDEVTERIKSHCHGWHSAVGMSDEALAQQIRDDGIDILIDLAGHSAYNRLPMFAWKPAPVQAAWLGYLATTGVTAIDYVIADAWTLPENEEINFTEKIWRLAESYLCFTPPVDSVDVGSLPALSKGYVTFGSFNNLSKMNDTVVALWARILAAIPTSRLFLKSPQLREASVQQSVVDRFATHGIGAERLILQGPVPRVEYLIPFQQVDIALDPFPYPGITTSVESLWMGVPVLTLVGQSFLARQGVGLMMNAGLPQWIATDSDDYVARAVTHAGNLQALAALRMGLRQQVLASPIFDATRFARHFEAALRGMWQTWCGQQQGKSS